MKILLISDSLEVYQQTKRLMESQNELQLLSFEAFKIQEIVVCDILVIHFDYIMVTAKEFKTILDAKCKSKVPILALLEQSSISDQFEVLAAGALDYLERPVTDELYAQKLGEMYKWKWYYDWEKTRN